MSNSFQQLLESLLSPSLETTTASSSSYLILVQHSQAFQLRHAASSRDDNEDAVFQSAGLRTPSENAARDWQAASLWFDWIIEEILLLNTGDVASSPPPSILWIQTIASSRRRAPQRTNVQVVDCSQDPFGWEDENNNTDKGTLNLNCLESVISAVNKNLRPNTVVLIDSLTPIVMRHGLAKTIRFLQKLQQQQSTARIMVVPVLVETLSTKQNIALQDIANAVLSLAGGEAVLLRQGVREKGNLVRDTLPYRINTIRTSNGEKHVIELLSTDEMKATTDLNAKVEASQDDSATLTAMSSLSMASTTNTSTTKRGKVQLQVDEGSRDSITPVTTAAAAEPPPQQPRIFLQDDDPEFDDYDEEDPDDDLEL